MQAYYFGGLGKKRQQRQVTENKNKIVNSLSSQWVANLLITKKMAEMLILR